MLMGRKLKNILIRDLTDQDNETLRAIMKETGCFQASKAIMRTAYSFLRMSAITKQHVTGSGNWKLRTIYSDVTLRRSLSIVRNWT